MKSLNIILHCAEYVVPHIWDMYLLTFSRQAGPAMVAPCPIYLFCPFYLFIIFKLFDFYLFSAFSIEQRQITMDLNYRYQIYDKLRRCNIFNYS